MKKKLLLIFFTMIMFVPLFINARVCDHSNVSSFGGNTTNSTVSGVKCPDWNYGKVYGFQNDDMVVICYPGETTKNTPMFFFDLYVADGNQCKKALSAGYWNNKAHNASSHASWLSWNNLKIEKVYGEKCPAYMYKIQDDFGASSYDVILTDSQSEYEKHMDSSNKFLWFIPVSTSTGGGTVEDVISEDEVITCVNGQIQNICVNNPNLGSEDINTKIKDSTKTCVDAAQQSYGIPLDQDAVDRFVNNVSGKIQKSETPKLTLECELMKKCSALSSFKQTNPTVEKATIISIYNKTATIENLVTVGVPSELANCLMNNAAAAQQQSEQTVSEITGTVGETTGGWGSVAAGKMPATPKIEPDETQKNCTQILGPNLTKIVKAAITIIQIAAAIIAIVKGMIVLIPAITAKDADGLKKAEKELVIMAVILIVIFLLKPIIAFIGKLFDYDLTCIL
ncbi:MAG: hypothetical protein IKR57_03000 [Bacilli bacterium]|nr:hypothetical protein [Bacilli bacterium]